MTGGLVLFGTGAPVWAGDAEGRPLGDIDQDCDTDLEDYTLFQHGMASPLAPPVGACCHALTFNTSSILRAK